MADWRDELIVWFQTHGRDLPWRRTEAPYRIWLSEVMLQQTQVDRVLAYYERWLSRFPTLEHVARADLDEVLALWTGLGYYSRARNFHRAARIVQEQHGGQVPSDRKALLRLPGVGPYTASAILAFAFNEPHPTLEANTERVYARLFDLAEPIKSGPVARRVQDHLRSLIPEGKARLFNTALMELGSLVCTPTDPACASCPAARVCLASARGTWPKRPVLPRPTPRIRLQAAALLLPVWDHTPAGRATQRPSLVPEPLLVCRRRPERGLWAGFWELPWDLVGSEESPRQAAERLAFALGARILAPLGRTSGSFTKYNLTLHGFSADLPARRLHRLPGLRGPDLPAPLPPPAGTLPPVPRDLVPRAAPLALKPAAELSQAPMPAAHRRLLALARKRLPTAL